MKEEEQETEFPLAIRQPQRSADNTAGAPSKEEIKKFAEFLAPLRKAASSEKLAASDRSPVADVDTSDPGDETQRNFRYQASVGAMLLIGIEAGKLPYRAIWCEQREDFLCELEDDRYDAFQVKTASPENVWHLKSEAFRKSVARFLQLDSDFPGRVRQFVFYSNADFLDSAAKNQKHRSIPKLLEAIRKAVGTTGVSEEDLSIFEVFLKDINGLVEKAWNADALFSVLSRTALKKGPSRDEFHVVLCQVHLPQLTELANASPKQLSRAADGLVSRVFQASSLHVTAGSRHYVAAIAAGGDSRPELQAKRLTREDVKLIICACRTDVFRYLSGLISLQLGQQRNEAMDSRRRQLKMERGGIGLYVDVMHRQALSAEARLLDLATRTDSGGDVYAQLENVVRSEVELARGEVQSHEQPYGKRMLLRIDERFRDVVNKDANRVYGESIDMLLGIAGLLTGQCLIWWSEKFDIEAAA